ncbi:MAG: MBOAT family protein [Bosea sp.]|uniref:MBOAT family O-acyltransferase n=1 Tax=Bosea sp. (in: a-proteobacteria) TaxID=1871050 RepID=UPI00238CDEFF|nr:MBOAT family protein [Bosea sp. (in: a-proteobacteria)]MCP4733333.1 MBOAT family protein [Bosea sp. (in: a-proteobacteria)]
MNPVDQAAVGTSFSLASLTFVVFAILACTAIALARSSLGASRATIAAANIAFLGLIGGSLHGWTILALFIHAAYGLTMLVRLRPGTVTKRLAIAGIAAAWVALFVNKNMDVFGQLAAFRFLDATIVGMSYLAFRAISVMQEAEDLENFNYIDFINYLIFFPTLLAGPIERYEPFQNDLRSPQRVDPDIALDAAVRITRGYVKKFVFADNLAPLGIFSFGSEVQSIHPALLWLGVLAQLVLIYLDFSGYCDIMIGIARLLGFRIQENFNRPYLARNIQDFWNSWHMSLTFFVRDYVFTPICRVIFWHIPKKRQFPYITAAYFVTMLVIALWHKLSIGFLLFGIMHGLALTYIQLKRKYLDRAAFARRPLGALMLKPPVPVAIMLTWTFFALSTVVWFFPVETTLTIFRRMALMG